MNFTKSGEWWARAEKCIPMGTQTLSKSPTQWVQGAHPIYLSHGRGAHVWDVDGNEFIDYPMALGPVILGYADRRVNAAIAAQLEKGITFSLMHPLEVEVAERIVDMVPGIEAVRFAKSGSDAVSAAVRAARAFTGRDVVLTAGYHGWHDWFIGTTTRNAGVPEAVQALSQAVVFDDLDAIADRFESYPNRIAAIVLEPSAAEVPSSGYLQGLVDLAHDNGAIVIFDEIITGFRLGRGGARERYGVIPDLSCYGKGLGNGMPISAVAGDWPIMSVFEEVFFSTTHGGETLSLAAARAVLDTIADGKVHQHINVLGRQMLGGIQEVIDRHGVEDLVWVSGEPERAVLGFGGDDPLVTKSFVQQTMGQHGILFNGGMFISASHEETDITRTLEAFSSAFETLGRGDDLRSLLVGAPVEAVFRVP